MELLDYTGYDNDLDIVSSTSTLVSTEKHDMYNIMSDIKSDDMYSVVQCSSLDCDMCVLLKESDESR